MAAVVPQGRRSPATDALLEREDELQALAALIEGATEGRGGVAVIEGSPGAGKSALLDQASHLGAEMGMRVLRARAHELERSYAWGVARSLLEVPVADPGEGALLEGRGAPAAAALDPGAPSAGEGSSAEAIAHGLYWVVARVADRGPLLMVVDDAHWADEPSLRFLVHLLGRVEERPIAVVVGTRPGDEGLLTHLTGDPAAVVRRLAPLGAGGVAALVRRRIPGAGDPFCARCLALTAGNPLHLRELLLALPEDAVEPAPADLDAVAGAAAQSLGHTVLRRLASLSERAQRIARAVAVVEDDVPLQLAASVAAATPAEALEAADELGRADILRPGDPLGFTHPLLRAAVYGQLSFAERAASHLEVAHLLVRDGASGEEVSAHLLEGAATADPAVTDILRASARRALDRGVPESAVSYLERALREPPPDAGRAAVLGELGKAEAIAGRPEAVTHLEAAVALQEHPHERAALLLELGRMLGAQGGRLKEAGAAFRRGLAELGPGGGELAMDLEGAALTAAMHDPDIAPGAYRRVEEILGGDHTLETRAGRGLASKAMLMRLYQGGPRDEVLALAHRIFGEGRLVEEDRVDSQALTHVIGAIAWCDDYAGAERALELTFADARRRGSLLTLATARRLRARLRLWTGSVDDAVEDARAALDVGRRGPGMYVHVAGCSLVTGLLLQGRVDDAAQALALGAERPASGFFAAWLHTAEGRVAAARGDHAAAHDHFLATGRCLRELMMVNPTVLPWRSEAALAAQRLGDEEEARALVAEELELAEAFGAPRAIGVAGRAAGLLERGERAVDLQRSAMEILASSGARVEHAAALVELGAAIRRAGRPREARDVLRETQALAESVAASALAERARGELRLAGGRGRASEAAPGGLTPSERRVADLAADGQTNREIATALFITVKAVEWHLGNAYRKLEIGGRRELAEALGEAPPAAP